MVFAAEDLATAGMAFAARQVYAAMFAAHHVLGHPRLRRLLAGYRAAIFFQQPPGERENQNE